MDPEELKRLFLLTPPAPEPATAKQPSPAKAEPGKQPFKTGDKYLDEGAVCEREDHAGSTCFLEKGQRERISDRMMNNMSLIASSYHAALEQTRVDLLMHKKTGWGPVGELLFDLALSAMTAGIGLAVSKIAKAGVKAFLQESQTIVAEIGTGVSGMDELTKQVISGDVKIAKEVVKSAGKLVKPSIKAQCESFPAEVAAKGQFINALRDQSGTLLAAARNQALAVGDDAVLITMLGAYNPEFMTASFFVGSIKSLLERFDQHAIADIGTNYAAGSVKAGTTETVLVASNGYSRLAVVRFGERNVLGRSQGETWYTDGGDDFVSFVDEDFADLATQTQRANVGDVKIIDVHKGHSFRKSADLDNWIAETQVRAVAGFVRGMGSKAKGKQQ